ncbi:transcription factor 7-like 2 [Eleginops maclovinus]|uniref:transcription factor 7-like 2 n=1 Tax=Eleginops maclovinus TaxID=56733 RepID=UPI0030803397
MGVGEGNAGTIIDVPMVNLPEGHCLCYVGMFNGQEFYEVLPAEAPPPYFPPPAPAAPSLSYKSKKRGHKEQQDRSRPYVRKPLNAFMLYMKEHRDHLKAEVDSKGRGTATVNAILGQRWNALTEEKKEKYLKLAQEERLLHAQQNPDWSTKENYGRKMRKRKHAPSSDKGKTMFSCEM